MFFLTETAMLKSLVVQMVSAVTVGLNFDNLSMSIYYLITSWIVQPNTAFPAKHLANVK